MYGSPFLEKSNALEWIAAKRRHCEEKAPSGKLSAKVKW